MSAPLETIHPDKINAILAEDMARFTHDPLGFVRYAFPWGVGELEGRGVREWQERTLNEIGQQLRAGLISAHEAIQIARASGHGIGKSALVAWLILWAMATREDTRGVVTANTEKQLTTKTWPELIKWHRLSVIRHWFVVTATAVYSVDPAHEKTWRVDAIPWSESNTEAFAGLHNEGKRILVIFDEASAIPNVIWEVAEGALTDEGTEIIWCAFGNPTRNTGRFFDCFHRLKQWWRTEQVDSRSVPGTNQRQFEVWEHQYGEDSDFFRVRVRGMFPSSSVMQFISRDDLQGAFARPLGMYRPPMIAYVGVDVARFGDDDSVIKTRCGRDMRGWPTIKVHGYGTLEVANAVAEHLNSLRSAGYVVHCHVDGGYNPGVIDVLNDRGYGVVEVAFGGKADDPKHYSNKRSEMAGRFRDWLKDGFLEETEGLETEALAINYTFRKDAVALEPKERLKLDLGWSPDEFDACILTFAHIYPDSENPTAPPVNHAANVRRGYNPYQRRS